MECELQPSLTARALKKTLPPRSGATRDARMTLNSAASMFTLYLSSVAQDHSTANKRQTIILKDVLQALRDMDFEHFIPSIEACLQETKSVAARKKSNKSAAKTAGGGSGDAPIALDDENDHENEEDDEDDAMASAEDIATEEDDDDDEHEAADDAAAAEAEDETMENEDDASAT